MGSINPRTTPTTSCSLCLSQQRPRANAEKPFLPTLEAMSMDSRRLATQPPARRSWLMALAMAALIPTLQAGAQAHMRGMYATKAEAEQRAAELKCKGVFAMGTMWMPCANERALHEALQKQP